MDLAEAIAARLMPGGVTVPEVEAIAGTRIYFGERPQGSPLPALVISMVSGEADELLEGEGDFWVSRVQLAALARSHEDAHGLAWAASAELLPAASVNVPGVGTMEFEPGQRSAPRDAGGESDERGFVHRAVSDLILRHSAGA